MADRQRRLVSQNSGLQRVFKDMEDRRHRLNQSGALDNVLNISRRLQTSGLPLIFKSMEEQQRRRLQPGSGLQKVTTRFSSRRSSSCLSDPDFVRRARGAIAAAPINEIAPEHLDTALRLTRIVAQA